MALKALPIRPGVLVTLSTRVKGGVSYEREDLREEVTDDGVEIKEWKTQKTTEDAEEYDRAVKTRLRIRDLVKSVCSVTPFGLICPAEDIEKLDEALRECERIRDEFNAGSTHCRVHFASLRGTIAENQAEAARAIRGEVSELLREMEEARLSGDVKTVRDLCAKATQVGTLLAEQELTVGSLVMWQVDGEDQWDEPLRVERIEDGAAWFGQEAAVENIRGSWCHDQDRQQFGIQLDELVSKDRPRDLLKRAIAAERRIARAITKRVKKEGEALADVLSEMNVSSISQARFIFDDRPSGDEDGDEPVLDSIQMGRFATLDR